MFLRLPCHSVPKCDSGLGSRLRQRPLFCCFGCSCWQAWWWRCLDSYNNFSRNSGWSLDSWLRECESILWAWMTRGMISGPVGGDFLICGLLWRLCVLAPRVGQQLSDSQAEGNVPHLLVMAKDVISLASQIHGVFVGLAPGSLVPSRIPALLMLPKAPHSLCSIFLFKAAQTVSVACK